MLEGEIDIESIHIYTYTHTVCSDELRRRRLHGEDDTYAKRHVVLATH
jgi:hypothetical protein